MACKAQLQTAGRQPPLGTANVRPTPAGKTKGCCLPTNEAELAGFPTCREAYEPTSRTARSPLQFRVFGLAFLQDRDIGVGIFPERKKIVVGGFCFSLIS